MVCRVTRQHVGGWWVSCCCSSSVLYMAAGMHWSQRVFIICHLILIELMRTSLECFQSYAEYWFNFKKCIIQPKKFSEAFIIFLNNLIILCISGLYCSQEEQEWIHQWDGNSPCDDLTVCEMPYKRPSLTGSVKKHERFFSSCSC